jgi:type IV fimbrial biogenesis protein FimT
MQKKSQFAFTMLELMITVVIAAILLISGVPSFQRFSQRQHMKAAVIDLQNDLTMAKSEAIYRNEEAVACPGSPSTGCAGSSDWSAGWIVFGDSNRDRQRQVSEPLLRHGQGYEHMFIHGSSGRTSVRFFPDGSTPGSNGSITFCGLGGPGQARKLVISNLGRIRRDTAPDLDSDLCP